MDLLNYKSHISYNINIQIYSLLNNIEQKSSILPHLLISQQPHSSKQNQVHQLRNLIHYYSNQWESIIKYYLNDTEFVQIYRKNNQINFQRPKYNQTIINYSSKHKSPFKTKYNHVFSRAYFKLWQILQFGLLRDVKYQTINVACLAQGPGGFINAIIDYRKYTKDYYYCITLKNQNNDWNHKRGNSYAQQITKQGYTIKFSYGKDGTGNLLYQQNINYFAKIQLDNKKCQLVTADGGKECENPKQYRYQQLHNASLFFAQIVTALKIQKYGGCFILKLYDCQFNVTIQMIGLICKYYKRIDIYKPLTSRPANSERYLIAQQFLGISNQQLKQLFILLKDWVNCEKNGYCENLIDLDQNWMNRIREKLNYINDELNKTQIQKLKKGLQIGALIRSDYQNLMLKERMEQQIKYSIQWCKKMNFPYLK